MYWSPASRTLTVVTGPAAPSSAASHVSSNTVSLWFASTGALEAPEARSAASTSSGTAVPLIRARRQLELWIDMTYPIP